MMNVIRFVAAMLALCGLGLLVVGSAGAVPKPPPRFWSAARCERVILERPRHLVRQVLCVPSGGPPTCRWTSGHRTRFYSEFTVFTRYRQAYVRASGVDEPGVVRSFTLATRARHGFAPLAHNWGDEYVGWPADFFTAHVRVLATDVPPAHFRSVVAPIAAHLMQKEKTTSCTGR